MKNGIGVVALLMAFACGNDDGARPPGQGGAGATGGGAAAAGAGASGGGAAPTCDTDYDRIAAQTAPVTFRGDVMPVLMLSCSGTSCHCNRDTNSRCYSSGPAAGLFLGASVSTGVTVAEVADAVHANLVDVESLTAPGVMRIAAGDPASSFLIHKISDTQDAQGYDCTPQAAGVTGCGTAMPPGGETITLCTQGDDGNQEVFDRIARWVQLGAAND